METTFELPVMVGGRSFLFPGRLVSFGYTYHIIIEIEKHEYVFEKDDERNYRVIGPKGVEGKGIDKDLIEAIMDALDHLSA